MGPSASPVTRAGLLAIFVLSGFAGLIYQSIWSRYLGLFLGHAAYAQALCRWLLVERPDKLTEDNYLAYTYNRFQACRFGLEGEVVDPVAGVRRTIAEDVAATLEAVAVHARELDCEAPLALLGRVAREGNDARWMREAFADAESLPGLVWQQAERFRAGG